MADDTGAPWELPYPELGDGANIETAVKPLADKLHDTFDDRLVVRSYGAHYHFAGEVLAAAGGHQPLPTPDIVEDIVLENLGLMFISFHAAWRAQDPASGVFATVYLNGTALRTPVANLNGTSPNQTAQMPTNQPPDVLVPLMSSSVGLISGGGSSFGTNWGSVSTGEIIGVQNGNGITAQGNAGLGGPIMLRAAAGTYDIEVRYRCVTNTLTVADRHLVVWTLGL